MLIQKMIKMKRFQMILALMVAVVFSSCGDENKNKALDEETITIGEDSSLEQMNTTEGLPSEGEAIQRENGVVQVNLTGNDQMQYNLNEIRVKAGDTVRLTLTHIGEMPENQMGHNFVLLTKGTDVIDFGTAAASARSNDYIPEGTNQVIAHTEMIGGGEETTIEFIAPEPGTYNYLCSFPGHWTQMQGNFIVE